MHEFRATKVAGGPEFMCDPSADESGHRLIERRAEFDGLEAFRFFVDAGQGEGCREAGDGGEQRHPIDPAGKSALSVHCGGKQEEPIIDADAEVLLATVAGGEDLARFLHFIEGLLDGLGKIAGGTGDGSGVAGVVGEQPSHDFRPGIHAEERPQGEEQVIPHPRLRRLAHASVFQFSAQQSMICENRLGVTEVGDGVATTGEEKGFRGLRRSGFSYDAPFTVGDLLADHLRDGGKHARIRHARPIPVKTLETLEADAAAEFHQPVHGLVHQAGIVTAEAGGGEQEGFWVDDPIVASARPPRYADGGPLAPKQIYHPLGEAAKRILE